MNLTGFRYSMETQFGERWTVNVTSDDLHIVKKFYEVTLRTNPKRPARIMDRSTGTALSYHTGSLKSA